MSFGSTTVEDDRRLARAAIGLDRKSQRAVRRAVRRGRPITDPASLQLTTVYLDLLERQYHNNARSQRALRWLWLLMALIFLVHGVFRILYPGGVSGYIDLIPGATALAGFFVIPYASARQQACLVASRRAIDAARAAL